MSGRIVKDEYTVWFVYNDRPKTARKSERQISGAKKLKGKMSLSEAKRAAYEKGMKLHGITLRKFILYARHKHRAYAIMPWMFHASKKIDLLVQASEKLDSIRDVADFASEWFADD